MAQTVKHLPAMRETRVQSLGWEELLEKEMATLSSILAWKILWTKEPGRLLSMGLQRVRHDSATEQQNFCLVFKRGWGFPGGSDGKASACNAGDPGSIPGSG